MTEHRHILDEFFNRSVGNLELTYERRLASIINPPDPDACQLVWPEPDNGRYVFSGPIAGEDHVFLKMSKVDAAWIMQSIVAAFLYGIEVGEGKKHNCYGHVIEQQPRSPEETDVPLEETELRVIQVRRGK